MYCLVLSQITRVTDGQTDRITTANTALAAAGAVKTLQIRLKIFYTQK